jgi:acyl-CoA synthetase (AMP-forming)/AMP-acid ligase II
VAAPGAAVTAEELIAWSRERLAHYKCPTAIEFVDSLPRNASGKLLKITLRDQYRGVSLDSTAQGTHAQPL